MTIKLKISTLLRAAEAALHGGSSGVLNTPGYYDIRDELMDLIYSSSSLPTNRITQEWRCLYLCFLAAEAEYKLKGTEP